MRQALEQLLAGEDGRGDQTEVPRSKRPPGTASSMARTLRQARRATTTVHSARTSGKYARYR